MKNIYLNKFAFLMFFSVVLLAGLAQEASAATRTVTKIADTNDGFCNADCSLREAVAVAASGDTVVFQPALGGQTITLGLGVIMIGKNLTISGLDNLSVSGNNASRIFYIYNGANVTINNLEMLYGYATTPDPLNHAGDGGAIMVYGGALNLNDSEVHHNKSKSGGAIAVVGALKIKNSYITKNTASVYGGGIYAAANNTIEVTDSKIYFNQANRGAGIFVQNCLLKMTNSTVYKNTAVNASAGFPGKGGGIYLEGISLGFNSSENIDAIITNSAIYDNSAAWGGGIYNEGDLFLINSTLSENQASTHGGGLVHIGWWSETKGQVVVRNSTITLNSAVEDGGGINKLGDFGEINLGNTIVSGNTNANNTSPEIKGTVVSLGYNLFGSTGGASILGNLTGNQVNTNPKLMALAKNGGATMNHLPTSDSPAINAGSNALALDANGMPLATDQRGFGRINMGNVDIGAVERRRSESVLVITGTLLNASGGAVPNATVLLTNTATGEQRSASSDRAGSFSFEEVAMDERFVVEVQHETMRFESQQVLVIEGRNELTMRAMPE